MPNPAVAVDAWAGSACYPQSNFYPLSFRRPTSIRTSWRTRGLTTGSNCYGRITNARFRGCSGGRPCSQAYICVCTTGARFHRGLVNLGTPPLHFRRHPPQVNYPPDTVPRPDYGTGLVRQTNEGGISTATPPEPKSRLQSLPPMLSTFDRRTVSSCSKASWGLFV